MSAHHRRDVLKDLFAQVRSDSSKAGPRWHGPGHGGEPVARERSRKAGSSLLYRRWMNNAGNVQPVDAAQIATQFGIRVYTIGVGTRGKRSPVARPPERRAYRYDHVDVEMDEEMLQEVVARTDGRYFRATDEAKLRAIYAGDRPVGEDRIKVTEHSRRNEEYLRWPSPVAACCLLGLLLDRSLFPHRTMTIRTAYRTGTAALLLVLTRRWLWATGSRHGGRWNAVPAFRFARPCLVGLLAGAVLVLLYLLDLWRRNRACGDSANRCCSPARWAGSPPHVPAARFLTLRHAFSFAVLALAGPQWAPGWRR